MFTPARFHIPGVFNSQKASPEETRPKLGCPKGVRGKAARFMEQLPRLGAEARAFSVGVLHAPLQPCKAGITDLRLRDKPDLVKSMHPGR